jgi:2-polyprenyl-3-methyl-5-hydroxy-6-metoxy-1,4-benzoquinol methylase
MLSYTIPEWYYRKITADLGSKVIVEVGSGRGELCQMLEEEGANCVATDLSKKRIREASFKVSNLVLSDAQSLPFKPESIDVLISIENIEHLENIDKFLEEAFRILKPNSKLYIKTPNRITYDIFFLMQKRSRKGYFGHKYVLTHNGLKKWMKNTGFKPKFFKSDILEYQLKKLSLVFRVVLKNIPFEKLPLELQPSIYCIASKE